MSEKTMTGEEQKRERRWYSLGDRRDRTDARTLWEEIFPEDSASFLDYYDQWKYPQNQIETRRRSGQLISMIQWNPYRIRLGDRQADSFYVIAVATRPEYRHQGLMAGELRDGFRRFREAGVPFIFLMPADPAIYEPFDFRYIYDRSVLTIPAEEAVSPTVDEPAAKDGNGDTGKNRVCPAESGSLTVRPLTPDEWKPAAEFSEERLAAHFRVYAERDGEYVERSAWECRSEGGDAEGIFLGSEMIGTFSWWWESETVVGIREMILRPEYETKAGLAQIRGALIARWPEAEEIRAVVTVGTDQAEPIIMGRILDLPGFLRGFTCPETVQTVLRVRDRYLKENDGAYLWTMGPQGSQIEPLHADRRRSAGKALTDEGEEAETQDIPEVPEGIGEIRAEIGALLPWLTGYGEAGKPAEEFEGIEIVAEGRKFARCVEPLRGVFFPEIV